MDIMSNFSLSQLFPITCFLVHFLLFSLIPIVSTCHLPRAVLFVFFYALPAILFVFLYTPHAMSHLPCFIAFSTHHTLRATCYFLFVFFYVPPATSHLLFSICFCYDPPVIHCFYFILSVRKFYFYGQSSIQFFDVFIQFLDRKIPLTIFYS